ncbi:hypothetical protein ABGB05_07150 [Plantactinospora sp. B5E13]
MFDYRMVTIRAGRCSVRRGGRRRLGGTEKFGRPDRTGRDTLTAMIVPKSRTSRIVVVPTRRQRRSTASAAVVALPTP